MLGKRVRPRKFHYQPWFYDPVKEEFNQRVKEAKAFYHEEKEEYKPRGSFNFRETKRQPSVRGESRYHRNYAQVSTFRIVMLVALLGALVYVMFNFL